MCRWRFFVRPALPRAAWSRFSSCAATSAGRRLEKSCAGARWRLFRWRCAMTNSPRLVEVRQKVLKQNDVVARELRATFARAGVFVVSLVSSPGAGKTSLLEETLRQLI